MAYQNVGQCKFFVDHGLWLNSLGLFSPPTAISSVMGLNPTNIITSTETHYLSLIHISEPTRPY